MAGWFDAVARDWLAALGENLAVSKLSAKLIFYPAHLNRRFLANGAGVPLEREGYEMRGRVYTK